MANILLALELLFGCWHRNLSRPFTLSGWTYEVCLNCGKEFAYDRAEIGVAQKRNVGHRRGSLHGDCVTISQVQPVRYRALVVPTDAKVSIDTIVQ
jgi:hypothetical protein